MLLTGTVLGMLIMMMLKLLQCVKLLVTVLVLALILFILILFLIDFEYHEMRLIEMVIPAGKIREGLVAASLAAFVWKHQVMLAFVHLQ